MVICFESFIFQRSGCGVTAAHSVVAREVGVQFPPPRRARVDQLIAGSNRKTAAFLQLLKETGLRCGEAWKSKWTDFDFEQNILAVNKTEKRGKPRQLRISDKTG